MKNLDTYLQEVIDNIRSDREVTKELLDDVFKYLSKNESHHREVGPVAAKYVENPSTIKRATGESFFVTAEKGNTIARLYP